MKTLQKFSLLIVTVCFIFVCFRLVHAYSDRFEQVEQNYRDKLAVNLDDNAKASDIQAVLLARDYVSDPADAKLIAGTIADSLKQGRRLSSLYDLQKRVWQIPVGVAEERGGEQLRKRAGAVREAVSVDSVPATISGSVVDLKMVESNKTTGSISVRVIDHDTAVAGVPICLRGHSFDTLNEPQEVAIAFAVTDSNGKASFVGLDLDGSYSVRPFRKDYEYGSSRGTTGGTLGTTEAYRSGLLGKIKPKKYGNLSFTFEQRPNTIRLFADATLRNIHDDNSLTVRTPDDWKGSVTQSAVLFIVVWLVLCGAMWMRRRGEAVIWPAAVMMGITGLGMIGMFSFNNPLTDAMLALDFRSGILTGVILMTILQFINIRNFYSGPLFDVMGTPMRRKGFGYYLLALGLTVLLFTPLGHSVGGMSVNLDLGFIKFQPSEIAKYLIVIFLSAWFCRKAATLMGYSSEGNLSLFWEKIKHLSPVFLALFILLAIYMVLGDMGPGLVLVFTFIIMYSIVKSKLDGDNGSAGWSVLVRSDLFQLLFGIATFLLLVWIGKRMHAPFLFAMLWFLGWVIYGVMRRRQFFETPVMANIVLSVFIFARNLPGAIGERFAKRSEMSGNTWGQLGLDGSLPDPTSNSQVAEGLWGLASGGFCGQGFGNGSPHFIPAFHTDMVLTSMGEQMGLFGLLVVILLLLSLLHHFIAIGYRSRNQFTFFLCVGIAVVTAVQFAIISLGCTGVIPLTGIAVPLLSYGKVSMILNLMAFGLVLSVETYTFAPKADDPADQAAANMTRPYSKPIALTRLVYLLFTVFVLCVFAHTTVLTRNKTLVRPLFVTAATGQNLVQYNPRIATITRQLNAGNIYDRNGLLLATSVADSVHAENYASLGVGNDELKAMLSKHTRRYYPFGDRLLFMVGNANSRLSLAYNEHNPAGFLAESQYMSYLRGFDNVRYYDEEHTKPCIVNIESENYVADNYQPPVDSLVTRTVIRDYSVLLPLLKAGKNSRRIERVNKGKSRLIKPQDLHMTLDAALQCKLQDRLAYYVSNNASLSKKRLLRISTVVLDAADGDVLASALYPLPNQDTILAHVGEKYYRDGYFPKYQWAYTDRDLGLTFQTAPGSSAKVMTAMAGLQKEGRRAANQTFEIDAAEQIEVGIEPTGNVTMREAIVKSSNCYFVNLLNHFNLYSALDSIYSSVGARVGIPSTKTVKGVELTPYFLRYAPMTSERREVWKSIIGSTQNDGMARYQWYMANRAKNKMKLNYGAWQWAWGQGTLSASPLNMARVVAALAGGGSMPVSRYLLDEERKRIPLVSSESADLLKDYMHEMAIKANGTSNNSINDPNVGGKTGTPERVLKTRGAGRRQVVTKLNDGWFIFYVDNCVVNTPDGPKRHPLAVAVRAERLAQGGEGSGTAMRISRDVVLSVLSEMEYR